MSANGVSAYLDGVKNLLLKSIIGPMLSSVVINEGSFTVLFSGVIRS